MVKKILKALFTLVLSVGLGFVLWLTCMDGTEKIREKNSTVPETPQNTYQGFYYTNLDSDEKIAYELIMAEIKEQPKKIQIPVLDEDGLSDLFEALLYDNPTLFFVSENCRTETNSFGKCYFVPEYTMDVYEYDKSMAELEKIRDEVMLKTADSDDAFSTELIIHDYVVNKCRYSEKTGGAHSSSYGCLVKGSASCEGYAKAIKYLLDESGIENYLAVGTTEDEGENITVGHAWNIVKINGEYYHLDATWDDPVGDEDIVSYSYFNITDKEISETHSVEERFLGRCTENAENYYVKNSIYFTSYTVETRNTITSELARQARLGNDSMSFKMSDKEALTEATEALFEMNGIYSILLSASLMTEETLTQDTVMYSVDEKHNIITIWDFIV